MVCIALAKTNFSFACGYHLEIDFGFEFQCWVGLRSWCLLDNCSTTKVRNSRYEDGLQAYLSSIPIQSSSSPLTYNLYLPAFLLLERISTSYYQYEQAAFSHAKMQPTGLREFPFLLRVLGCPYRHPSSLLWLLQEREDCGSLYPSVVHRLP